MKAIYNIAALGSRAPLKKHLGRCLVVRGLAGSPHELVEKEKKHQKPRQRQRNSNGHNDDNTSNSSNNSRSSSNNNNTYKSSSTTNNNNNNNESNSFRSRKAENGDYQGSSERPNRSRFGSSDGKNFAHREARRSNLSINERYNQWLAVLVEADDVVGAERKFSEMVKEGGRHNNRTQELMLRLCAKQDFERTQLWFDRFDSQKFSDKNENFVDGPLKLIVNETHHLIENCKQRGLRSAASITYTPLLQLMADPGSREGCDSQEALRIVRDMVNNDETVEPELETEAYNAALEICVASSDLAALWEIFDLMQARGVPTDPRTYRTIAKPYIDGEEQLQTSDKQILKGRQSHSEGEPNLPRDLRVAR